MKNAGKARSYGLYRHLRTSKEIIENLLNYYTKTKNTGFERRFLMKRVDESWKIDALQERLDGWQRSGL